MTYISGFRFHGGAGVIGLILIEPYTYALRIDNRPIKGRGLEYFRAVLLMHFQIVKGTYHLMDSPKFQCTARAAPWTPSIFDPYLLPYPAARNQHSSIRLYQQLRRSRSQSPMLIAPQAHYLMYQPRTSISAQLSQDPCQERLSPLPWRVPAEAYNPAMPLQAYPYKHSVSSLHHHPHENLPSTTSLPRERSFLGKPPKSPSTSTWTP